MTERFLVGNRSDLAGILWDEVPNCSFVQLVDTTCMRQCVKPVCAEAIVSFTRSVDTSSGTTIGDQIDEHFHGILTSYILLFGCER